MVHSLAGYCYNVSIIRIERHGLRDGVRGVLYRSNPRVEKRTELPKYGQGPLLELTLDDIMTSWLVRLDACHFKSAC